MDKVKIKRVNKHKKPTGLKEKILAGLGVGVALSGGAVAGVSKADNQKPFVKTLGNKDSKSSNFFKNIFDKTIGIPTAQADDNLNLDPSKLKNVAKFSGVVAGGVFGGGLGAVAVSSAFQNPDQWDRLLNWVNDDKGSGYVSWTDPVTKQVVRISKDEVANSLFILQQNGFDISYNKTGVVQNLQNTGGQLAQGAKVTVTSLGSSLSGFFSRAKDTQSSQFEDMVSWYNNNSNNRATFSITDNDGNRLTTLSRSDVEKILADLAKNGSLGNSQKTAEYLVDNGYVNPMDLTPAPNTVRATNIFIPPPSSSQSNNTVRQVQQFDAPPTLPPQDSPGLGNFNNLFPTTPVPTYQDPASLSSPLTPPNNGVVPNLFGQSIVPGFPGGAVQSTGQAVGSNISPGATVSATLNNGATAVLQNVDGNLFFDPNTGIYYSSNQINSVQPFQPNPTDNSSLNLNANSNNQNVNNGNANLQKEIAEIGIDGYTNGQTVEIMEGDNFDIPSATVFYTDGSSEPAQVSGDVDANTVGWYQIEFSSGSGTGSVKTFLNVVVKASEENEVAIDINGYQNGVTITLKQGEVFQVPSATSRHSYKDGRVIEKVAQSVSNVDTTKAGDYEIEYSDGVNGSYKVYLFVKVVAVEESAGPTISILGTSTVEVMLGTKEYDLPKAKAVDGRGQDITDKIVTWGVENVNTNRVGTYIITYSVTDDSGKTVSATVSIEVKDITYYGSGNINLNLGTGTPPPPTVYFYYVSPFPSNLGTGPSTSAGSTPNVTSTFTPVGPGGSAYFPEPGGGGGGGGGGGCFTAGMKVTMADGSFKNIEDIKDGDVVLSRSEDGQILVPNKVLNWHFVDVATYLVVNGELNVTAEHVMKINDKWQPAAALKLGDRLFDRENKEIIVNSINTVSGEFKVYNFTVENSHTYFANGIWVHNNKSGDSLFSNKDAADDYYYDDWDW